MSETTFVYLNTFTFSFCFCFKTIHSGLFQEKTPSHDVYCTFIPVDGIVSGNSYPLH